MTGAAWASVALLAQLGSATIDIRVSDSAAVVDARYRILDAADAVRVVVIRFPRQRLEWLDGPVLRTADGLYEGMAPAGPSQLHLRYRVTGAIDRIPLPVPGLALAGGAGGVSIRVTGMEALRLDDAFPRFARDGAAFVARPTSVPSFVRVPGGNRLFTNRVADGVVLAMVMLAIAIGLRREWRRRRRARA